jgi:hypothetical protein
VLRARGSRNTQRHNQLRRGPSVMLQNLGERDREIEGWRWSELGFRETTRWIYRPGRGRNRQSPAATAGMLRQWWPCSGRALRNRLAEDKERIRTSMWRSTASAAVHNGSRATWPRQRRVASTEEGKRKPKTPSVIRSGIGPVWPRGRVAGPIWWAAPGKSFLYFFSVLFCSLFLYFGLLTWVWIVLQIWT